MKHVVFLAPGQLEWREVADARVQGPNEAVVKPVVIGRCDLDRLYLAGRMPLAAGEPIGHEIIGEIVELGPGAERTFHVGQRVFVAAQISCGQCAPCKRGATSRCIAVPFGASYGMGRAGGYGGALAERIRVPFAEAMLVPLPSALDPVPAIGLADMATDAWRAVAPQLAVRPSGRVLVTGGPCPVISLYAAGIAVSLGAGSVDYVDADSSRRAIAREYGADAYENIESTEGMYDVVVDGASDPMILADAVRRCAPDALVTSVAPPFSPPPLPMLAMYHKGITWRVARPDCRAGHDGAIDACLQRGFRPDRVGPKIFRFDDAIEAWLDPALYVAVRA